MDDQVIIEGMGGRVILPGDQQLIEIAKALSIETDILIMDEPTSALTESEVARLFRVIGRLRERGVTVLYISHKMDEVFRLADRIAVLRDGRLVELVQRDQTDTRRVTHAMVGREIEETDLSNPRTAGDVVLAVEHLWLPWPGHVRAWRLEDISFTLRRGEILGIAGLMGAGRTELAHTLFGMAPADAGSIRLRGSDVRFTNNREAIAAGIFGAPFFVVDGEPFWGNDRKPQIERFPSTLAEVIGRLTPLDKVENVRNDIKIHLVSSIEEVLELALQPGDPFQAVRERDDPFERRAEDVWLWVRRRQDVRLFLVSHPDELAFGNNGVIEFLGLEHEPRVLVDADRTIAMPPGMDFIPASAFVLTYGTTHHALLEAGVVVVEASRRSGSLITARLANDFGRDVFAVPGSVFSQTSAGAHELLRDGAILCRGAEDVLTELFPSVGPPRAATAAAPAALRVLRTAEGRAMLGEVLDNARYLRDGLERIGFAVVSPQELPAGAQMDAPGVVDGNVVTPIIPVLVGDDWKAVLLWRALYDAGVFVNTALHPAVPPGGALLRTSVMATHDRATLDRSLERFAEVKRTFEAEHGPLPGPGEGH